MAYTTAQLELAYTNANLGKAPDAATKLALDAYASQTVSGGLSDSAALANTLKLVNSTTAVAIQTYQFFTGVAPSAAGLDYLVDSADNANDLNDAYYAKFAQENRFINFSINLATGAGAGAAAFATAYTGVSYAQTVATAYDKIIGNAVATAAGVDVAAAVAYLSRQANIDYLTAFVKANTPFTATADIELAVKAALIGTILNAATVSGIGGYATATTAMINDLSDGALSTNNAAGVNLFTAYPTAPVAGKSFTLTTGADVGASFVGTANNDTFNAAESAGNTVVTVGDTLDGGIGADTLNITQTAAFAVPVGLSVSNIETVNLVTGTTGTVIDITTGFSGVTALNVTGKTTQTITAGSSTAVTVTNSTSTGTLTVTGGSSQTVTETGASSGATNLSGSTGAVSLTSSIASADGSTGNTISVTGGSTVSVVQKSTNAVNTTVTDGAITVTGTSATKSVSVTNDRAAGQTGTTVGHVNANVTINDVNRTSTSAAGTIDTVTVASFATLAVNSGALKTVNLSGTGTTLNLGTLGNLATPANSALTINSSGLTVTGTTAIDSDITALTLNGTTSSSTYTGTFTASGVTALTVTGDARVTLTDQALAALTTVTSTNTSGVILGAALGTGVTFTGGTGADTITLSNAFTKAITMGDGNDTVTYGGAAGTGGSVAAGAGTDTIKMTAAQADAADADATFNTNFTGFEVLDIATGAAATTINLAGVNGVNQVVTRGAAGALQFDGFTSGGTLTLDAAVGAGSYVANVTNAVLTASDTFNLSLSNSTAGAVAFGAVTLAGIETVNISLVDAGTGGNANATIDTATITAAAATSIKVSGNNGLTLTNTASTAVTSFDASGVVGNSSGDTAANLAVTYTSANSTTSAAVTIVGGAGNDVLTGNAAKDTITGGAGADTLRGGAGQDTLNVGNGRDIVTIASSSDATAPGISESTTAAADIVNGFTLASAIATATDLSTAANYRAATAGGANASLLNIDLTADDGGAGAGNNLAVAIEANATGTGQAAGVTFTVTNGILTLSGSGASTVDTLGEWLTEAAAVSATNGETVAFQFGSDTYVFSQNGTSDVLVQLVGVTGASALVLAGAATTASAGTILVGDSF